MDLRSVLASPVRRLRRILRKGENPRLTLLRRMPRNAVCAEIGVWKGGFSEKILDVTAPRRLHLIDPWEFQEEFSERMYGGSVAKSQADMDAIFEEVRARLGALENVDLNRGRSEDVLAGFPDGYFDWVYIDGNHYYEYVLRDLELCHVKVKPGGIVAGDDYLWGAKDGFPVRRAVQDFVNRRGLGDRLVVIGSQFMISR